ncbi:G1 family glutamic endopeptidase, partial [Alicyclobacillus fructus]|uniref:G1 family glutamic endopeptidase n=1 Tax=Alicyclobacillus fructus TaxID=2816082 RepID=UPI001F2DADC1
RGLSGLRQAPDSLRQGWSTFRLAKWSTFRLTNTDVHGDWTVPNVYNMNQPFGWAYSCTWVGIGGYNTPDLVQAGTEQDFYVSQYYTYNSNYYAWFEVYPLDY